MDDGCCAVVKLENLIAHTRQCQFNTSTSTRPTASPEQSNNLENLSDLLGLLDGDYNRIERLERLQLIQVILAEYSQLVNENEYEHDYEQDEVSYNDTSSQGRASGNELLVPHHEVSVSCESIWLNFLFFLGFISVMFLAFAPIAAIVISSLKLESCTQMPTLPRALLALGISLLISVVLEAARTHFYSNKFCVGLKCIQSFAFVSMVYVAIVVYSNLDYTIKTSANNTTLTCDSLLFEFSYWFVSSLVTLICAIIILCILHVIYDNLTTIWSVGERSYVLLSFIYLVPISGIIMSVSTITMSSIYFDSCPAIPSLTTRLVVFGTIGLVCWLIMLLNRNFTGNCCFWLFIMTLISSFIALAVSVHDNFPRELTANALLYINNCNATLFTYSFVIVCINYVIIGLVIFMYLIYGGICTCLFFR